MTRAAAFLLIVATSTGCGDAGPLACIEPRADPETHGAQYSAAAIATSGDFTCAITDLATITCWGAFPGWFYGGPASVTLDAATPVMTLDEPIAQLSVGAGHICAVGASGAVHCFGSNWAGQVGVPPVCEAGDATCPEPEPVTPEGLEAGVIAVSAGQSHTCALTADGRVLCFGMNWEGQTGEACDGAASYTECLTTSPHEVEGLTAAPVAVAAGLWSSCAVLEGGGAACWGWAIDGLLGNPDVPPDETSPAPWPVVGLTGPVVDLDVGSGHACAVIAGGGVECWGKCNDGQCGAVSGLDQTSAEHVPGLDGIAAVDASERSTCVLRSDGQVRCFGVDPFNLPYWEGGATEDVPSIIEGLPASVAEIGVGRAHACARTEEGAVLCWGDREYGQLGSESTGQAFPMRALGTEIASLPESTTCGVTFDGLLRCESTESGEAEYPLGEQFHIRAYVNGMTHQCYVNVSGQLFCWGSNSSSQLGAIDALDVGEPTRIDGVPETIVDVSARAGSTIALDDEGAVYLLSGPERIDDGSSSVAPPLPPLRVDDLGTGNRDVIDGSCVLRAEDDVVCLVRGFESDSVFFDNYPQIPAGTVALSRRTGFACFLSEEGAVSCSGEYDYDQLGHGVECPDPGSNSCYEEDAQPTFGLDREVRKIAGGLNHTCALDGGGVVWCWGAAYAGALGDGTRMPSTIPVRVAGIPFPVVDISVIVNTSCALVNCGAVYCWGEGIHADYSNGPRLVRGF